jgi:Mrp family chromosome partitioning ATPase
MNFIYDALKKAQQEGKVDDRWIPKAIDQSRDTSSKLILPNELTKEFSMLKQKVQQAHAEHGKQIIGITSSVPGEGRTAIAYFLALLLSQALNGLYSEWDKKFFKDDFQPVRKQGVLLIDGNLERPMLHRLFNTAQSPGLTDFFFNANTNSIFPRSVTVNHLYLITAGSGNGNRYDIWALERMKKLFVKLKKNFEYILIDAPPVLEHPETLSLCKLADGVLLVVKANLTRLEVINEAKQQLQEAGAKVLGVVLNERRFFIPWEIYKRI